MKSLFFCFLFGVFSITFSFSQVEFKRGDLVHENGESQRVFIRYTDQYETPSSFEYKINLDDNQVHLATPENFRKVIIDDAYYFEKHHVKIDVSRQKNISINRDPDWAEQSIFLQKIVDSKASLFRYTVGSLNYYFYQKEPTSVPVLLVYKDYVVDGKKMTNQHYKQQLINEFQCESIPLHTVQNLSYTESALQSFFIKYNECLGFLVKQIDDGTSGPSGFLGLGYNYNNKYDVELRYALTRNLTNNWENSSFKYNYFAFIVRYNFL